MAGKKPSRSVEGTEKVWGLKEIEQLIDVLIDRQVTEFEMEQNGAKIRVKRGNYLVSNPEWSGRLRLCSCCPFAFAWGCSLPRSGAGATAGRRAPDCRNTCRIHGRFARDEVSYRRDLLRGPGVQRSAIR